VVNEPLVLDFTIQNAPTGATVDWHVSPENAGSVDTLSSGKYVFSSSTTGSVTISASLHSSGETEPVATSNTLNIKVVPASLGTLYLSDGFTLVPGGAYKTMTATLGNVASSAGYSVLWTSSNSNVAYFSTSENTTGSSSAKTYFTGNSSTSSVYICSGSTTGEATITARLYYNDEPVTGQSLTRTVKVGSSFSLAKTPNVSNSTAFNLSDWSNWSSSGGYYYYKFSVDPYLNEYSILSSSLYDIYYTWTLNGYTVQDSTPYYNDNSFILYSNDKHLKYYGNSSSYYNTLTCAVTVYAKGTTSDPLYSDTAKWNFYTGYTSEFSVYATIYDSNPGYALTDTPDGSSTSIADQIDNWVRKNYYYGTSSYYKNYAVQVSGGTHYETSSSSNRGTLTSNSNWLSYSELSKIYFTPGSTVSSSTGSYQISFDFQVRFYNSNTSYNDDYAKGTMVFTVKQGYTSAGNINYSAGLGEDVAFNVSDFENFWSDIYSRGSLSYVSFSSTSGGTVYNSSNKSVGSGNYYVNPSRSQNALDGVYFSPSSSTSKKAGTVSIPFTACGTTSSGSSTTSRTGYVVITYLSAAANKITYSANASGEVSLRAQDFIDAYKAAVNTSSTPSSLTIVFQGVPSYGTLTYTDSSKSSAKAVRLTNSNIKSRSFTTKSTGSNQLGDVVYTASGSRTETISYIGYIGGTATFTGDVSFTAAAAPTDVRVTLPTCYTAAGVALNSAYFTSANASAMLDASFITFGTPKTGKLVSSSGTVSSAISMALLGNVTYVPAASPTSTSDSFAFSAYNASGTLIASGTVSVVVSLPAAPVNPNAITSITQFTDIPAPGPQSDWYRPQLTALINKGVINGKGNGKFGPDDALAYGEALKMIMNAAGYKEAEANEDLPGVSHWAQNYKNTAVQKGWLSSSVDLRATISRDSMAELTAKVLGIAPSSDATPFADSSNTYAVALYKNKIVQGELWDDGSRHFTPNKALTRNEMVCLVYNMYVFTGK